MSHVERYEYRNSNSSTGDLEFKVVVSYLVTQTGMNKLLSGELTKPQMLPSTTNTRDYCMAHYIVNFATWARSVCCTAR